MVKVNKKLSSIKLQGKNFHLRVLQLKDINKRYLSWMNDKEVNQYLASPKTKYSRKDLLDYFNKIHFNKKIVFAIIDNKNKKHVGNVALNPIDEVNKRTAIGGLIGEKKYWGTTAFTESMSLLIDYVFNVRKFIKIDAGAYEINGPCIVATKKVGFKLEGISKKNVIINGKCQDIYQFGLVNKKNEKYYTSN